MLDYERIQNMFISSPYGNNDNIFLTKNFLTMKMKQLGTGLWKKVGAGLCLFLMMGFVSCDDDDEVVEVFDDERFFTDFDGDGFFNDFDLDGDDLLDEDEFNSSFFEIWDTDNDGVLEETEFNTAAADFGVMNASWTTWDLDNDGVLEVAEFNTNFSAMNYWDTWDVDGDGFVMDREFTDGIFGLWDVDNDGILTEVEYNDFYGTYFVV